MTLKVHVYNIKYSKRTSVISVTGPDALRNWMEPKYINAYGKHYADVSNAENTADEVLLEFDVNFSFMEDIFNRLDQVEYRIKLELKEKTGLDIEKFNYKILNIA